MIMATCFLGCSHDIGLRDNTILTLALLVPYWIPNFLSISCLGASIARTQHMWSGQLQQFSSSMFCHAQCRRKGLSGGCVGAWEPHGKVTLGHMRELGSLLLLAHGFACSVHPYQVNIMCLALTHSLEKGQKAQSLECHHLVKKKQKVGNQRSYSQMMGAVIGCFETSHLNEGVSVRRIFKEAKPP